jgi:preprotein translocase subunit SecD
MTRIGSMLKDWRVILMLLVIVVAFLSIEFNLTGVNGAQVIYLSTNSFLGNLSAQGLTTLSTGSIITALNGIHVSNSQQFYSALNRTAIPNSTLTIHYENEVFPYIYSGSSVTIEVTGSQPMNSSYIQVQDVPFTKLNYGLDIIGGTQITVEPNSTNATTGFNSTVVGNLQRVLQTRLNTYGISGISISVVHTIASGAFLLISMPNVGESQALSLIQSQGIFYAKIGNNTIFNSTNKNEGILQVCLTSSCPYGGESPPTLIQGVYQFNFGIEISHQAAANFANATKNLSIVQSNGGSFLSKPIVLFLNGKQISSLSISPSLKNSAVQTISITGSAPTYQQAYAQMKTLQSTFESGSLPTPIKITSIQSVSSTSGSQFLNQIFLLLFAAFVAVSIVIFLRYGDYKVSALILLTSIAEIFIVIGVAALIHWTLDIPSFAGIIASIGISVDDQIIITDEIIRGSSQQEFTAIRKRITRAFFIIVVSFFSFAAIMFPLLFSTASLFTGFALTTILASLVGLLITRPAFAQLISIVKGVK